MREISDFATVEEAAVRMDRSVATVWRRIKQGELSTYRVLGRTVVLAKEVEALAAQLRQRLCKQSSLPSTKSS